MRALSTRLPPWLCVPGVLASVSELRLLFCEGPRWGRKVQGANTRSACLGQLFKTRCDLVGRRLAGAGHSADPSRLGARAGHLTLLPLALLGNGFTDDKTGRRDQVLKAVAR